MINPGNRCLSSVLLSILHQIGSRKTWRGTPMKKTFLATVVSAWMALRRRRHGKQHRGKPRRMPELSKQSLLAAAQAAGLADALATGENLTVFAPTDDAFAALPDGTVRDIARTGKPGSARGNSLPIHVLPRVLTSNQLPGRTIHIRTTSRNLATRLLCHQQGRAYPARIVVDGAQCDCGGYPG